MAENMTEETLADYKLVFDQYDLDHSGTISAQEMKAAISLLGHTTTDAEVAKMIAEMDQDNSGEIDFAEFVACLARRALRSDNEEEILEAFKVFDKDGNGELSKEELSSVLTSLGERLTQEECDEILAIADTDGSGTINFREFSKLLLSR